MDIKSFIESLDGKNHYELSQLKPPLVRAKLEAHRRGDKPAALHIHRKLELLKAAMAAEAAAASQNAL